VLADVTEDARGAGKRSSARWPHPAARDLDDAVAIANDIHFRALGVDLHPLAAAAFEFITGRGRTVMVNLPSAASSTRFLWVGQSSSSMGCASTGAVAVDFYTEMKTVYLKY